MYIRIFSAALCAVFACGSAAFAARTGYYPPKFLKRADTTVPIAGPGSVIVQVLVNADGSFKVQRIIKSTNHGDDAAALDIAKRSTYRPARREGVATTAFYSFTLNFQGKTVSSSDEGAGGAATAAVAGGGDQLGRMVRAGNYAGAKAAATQYLAAHPGDANAQTILGVAETFLNDYDGATASFDKVASVPPNYKAVAGKAYAEFAAKQINAGNGAAAIPAAKKAVDLSPGASTYNLLGTAQVVSGQFDAAAPNLEKARELGSKDDPKQRAIVDANLVAAYVGLGRMDEAKRLAAEAAQLDPANTTAQTQLVNYWVKKADAAASAGKNADAAANYEAAAAGAPAKVAVTMYANAAFAYLNGAKPDNAKARVDAEKALSIDQSSAEANYAEAIALANDGKTKEAITYLKSADASAKAAGKADLSARIQKDLKALGGG